MDWSSPEAIADLRVGDMASGTGVLLTAVYRRIAERHRIAGGDNAGIHRNMVEDVLIDCDIMPAAVHLTAARLSGEHPDIDYKRTRTWILPYGEQTTPGGSEIKIGSLDLLRGNQTPALWGNGTYAVTAYGDAATTTAEIPDRSPRCGDHEPICRSWLGHIARSSRGAGTGVGGPAADTESLAAVYRGRLGSQSPREPLRFSSVCPGSIRGDHGSATRRRYRHSRVCG